MKKIYLFLYLVLISGACQKSAEPNEPLPEEPVIELGKVAMDRDGQPWTADFKAYYTRPPEKTAFSFTAKTTSSNGVLEFVSIADIPCKAGIFNIAKKVSWTSDYYLVPKASLGWLLDGDQSLGMLIADSTYYDDNIVEVIRYDSIENVVEGRFQVRLKKSLGTPAAFGLPEEVSLTNGRFHLKIEE